MTLKEKIKGVNFPVRKIIYTLLIACFSSLILSVATVWNFWFLWFLFIFVSYFYCIFNIDKKEDLFYYFIKSLKALFFFLPIAAIFYTFLFTWKMVKDAWSSLDASAAAVWGAIWWFMVIFLSLIIWLVWWFIIWMFAKKPKEEINAKSIWILFLVLIILIFSYSTGNNSEKNLKNNSSDLKSTVQTWNLEEIEKTDRKEENLSDKIWFNLTSFAFVKWDFSENFEFSYDFENKSGKDIIWFNWKFEIYDIFNDKLGTFNINKIWEFKNNEKISEKENYWYNSFLSENVKLSKLKFEDLKFKYIIEKIIFSEDFDKNNKIFWKNTWKDIEKISYEILNKLTKKWDFSEYLEFEVKITNNSEKNIRWIKWSFSIYNIFWEKLWKYELNLTKEIKKWENLIEKINFNLNQFISEEYELWKTDFSLIKYNFDIEEIIYVE